MQLETSLVWVPCGGQSRDDVVKQVTAGCIEHIDMGDHLWVVSMNNRGSCLFCYGLQLGHLDDGKMWRDQWFVKRIPEDAGPDVYDCPLSFLDATRPSNDAWRVAVRKWHESN